MTVAASDAINNALNPDPNKEAQNLIDLLNSNGDSGLGQDFAGSIPPKWREKFQGASATSTYLTMSCLAPRSCHPRPRAMPTWKTLSGINPRWIGAKKWAPMSTTIQLKAKYEGPSLSSVSLLEPRNRCRANKYLAQVVSRLHRPYPQQQPQQQFQYI